MVRRYYCPTFESLLNTLRAAEELDFDYVVEKFQVPSPDEADTTTTEYRLTIYREYQPSEEEDEEDTDGE
jgi:hypothetical protein